MTYTVCRIDWIRDSRAFWARKRPRISFFCLHVSFYSILGSVYEGIKHTLILCYYLLAEYIKFEGKKCILRFITEFKRICFFYLRLGSFFLPKARHTSFFPLLQNLDITFNCKNLFGYPRWFYLQLWFLRLSRTPLFYFILFCPYTFLKTFHGSVYVCLDFIHVFGVVSYIFPLRLLGYYQMAHNYVKCKLYLKSYQSQINL